MKKKYIITFLFLLFLNINTTYAVEEVFYFEKDKFDTEAEFLKFYSNMCTHSETIITCNLVCEDGTEGSESGVGDASVCGNIDNLSKFRIRNGSFKETKEALNVKTQWEYIYKNYCTQYEKSPQDTDYYKLCRKIKEGDDSKDEADKYCTYNFKPTGTKEKIPFKIEIATDNEKIYVTPLNGVDGSTTTSDGTYWKGPENKLYFYEKNTSFEQFSADYIAAYNKEQKCPKISYCMDEKSVEEDGNLNRWYATMNGLTECKDNKYKVGVEQSSQNGLNNGLELPIDQIKDLIDKNKPINYLNCESLFEGEQSKKLLNLLHTIVTIVKISIPLLLLGLGILDFSKAVFAGSEDNMKKAQSKFIKRVLVSVCIFLIPTLLKLLLTIANSVWGNISSDFCGIL